MSQHLTGAGIMIIETYKNMNCFVLFKSSKNDEYNDPGGLIDPGESPLETACRECREETANLLKFNPSDLSHNVVVGDYISYIAYVNGIHKTHYRQNIKIVKQKCSHHWKENDKLVRVPIDKIDVKKLPYAKDYEGNTILLRGRTSRIVKAILNILPTILKHSPYQLKKNITKLSRNPCLLKTISYSVTSTHICTKKWC